jgi:hypothetical protein
MGFVRKVGRKIDKEILQPIKHTVEAILDDPKKIAMVALSVFAPGVGTALGTAMGLTGTAATIVGNVAVNTALNGGDVKAAILAAAIPVVGNELAGAASASFIDAGMDVALAESAGKVVSNAGLAAAQGKDPLTALISGGLSEGTAAITRDIPGFADLPDAAKRSINAAVATELSGGDGTQAAINAAMSAGINSLTNYTNSLNPAPADAVNQLKDAGPKEEETDWASLYNSGLSEEEIAKREALMASLPNQEMQIDPKNWDSFNKNLSDIMDNKGGYTSQWQTVGSDRIMINDDGTGIGTNENGDSYALDKDQVNSMIENGMLNTAASGYVAATGGTGNTPGGSGPAPTAPPKVSAPTKPGTAPGAPGATPTGTTTQPTARQSAVQEMAPALLGLPQLGNVFYYGKDFSSQKQQLDPSGRLIQQEYDPLSVSQAGPELQLDKMGGTNENDVQALIQQIMANSGGNISPEELAQILGQQGASYG